MPSVDADLVLNFTNRSAPWPDGWTAIVEPDGTTTSYSALRRLVGDAVAQLGRLGIGAGDVVGLRLGRKRDAMIGVLACLNVGATFLPVDLTAPAKWQRAALHAAGAAAVLVDDVSDSATLAAAGGTVASIDGSSDVQRTAPGRRMEPTHLAGYIITTSGTTGRQRGVVIGRDSLRRHLGGIRTVFSLSPADRVLQYAPTHVDVAIEQMLAPLSVGAAVVTVDEPITTPTDLVDDLRHRRVTVANLPAAYFNRIAEERLLARLRDAALRLVVSGGDRMSPEALRSWRRALPDLTLMNAYGPTESTITSTVFTAAPGHETHFPEGVPIGTAVGDRRLYVVDAGGRLCPPGTPGELWIGGAEVARGYLADPAATARHFTPDLFSDYPGARLYRTGDRVRWLPRYGLEFLGRLDRQVKIRGHRVEPGEVEAVLAAHPAVRTCVAMVRSHDDARLVAYAETVGITSGADLRAYLAKRLPPPMVPAEVVPVAELPLTAAGKVDRASLAGMDHDRPARSPVAAGVRGVTEQTVAAVWAEVLGIAPIGSEDNFFALGGDSLTAIQAVVALADRYGITVPPRVIFDSPTLATVAAAIDAEDGVADTDEWHAPAGETAAATDTAPPGTRPTYAIDVPALPAALAEIVAEVIDKPTVTIDDDFFTLGIHSLALVKVAARITALFDLARPTPADLLRMLFTHPTAAGLADALLHAVDDRQALLDNAEAMRALRQLTEEERGLLLAEVEAEGL